MCKTPKLSPREVRTIEKFWNDADAQRLLRSLCRLRKGGNENKQVCYDDIVGDLADTEGREISKKVLNRLLQKFCDESLISKEPVPERQGRWYIVASIVRLDQFITKMGNEPADSDRLVPPEKTQMSEVPNNDEEFESDDDGSSIVSSASSMSDDSTYECSDSSISTNVGGKNESKKDFT